MVKYIPSISIPATTIGQICHNMLPFKARLLHLITHNLYTCHERVTTVQIWMSSRRIFSIGLPTTNQTNLASAPLYIYSTVKTNQELGSSNENKPLSGEWSRPLCSKPQVRSSSHAIAGTGTPLKRSIFWSKRNSNLLCHKCPIPISQLCLISHSMCVLLFFTWWTLMCQLVLVLPHSTHNSRLHLLRVTC